MGIGTSTKPTALPAKPTGCTPIGNSSRGRITSWPYERVIGYAQVNTGGYRVGHRQRRVHDGPTVQGVLTREQSVGARGSGIILRGPAVGLGRRPTKEWDVSVSPPAEIVGRGGRRGHLGV